MSDLLKGNFQTKKQVVAAPEKELSLEDRFASRSSADKPFASPVYWGGFVHYGV